MFQCSTFAFTIGIGIALCKLVVITTMMPDQVLTNQNSGTVQPARTPMRSNGKLGIDRQRAKYGWSTAIQHRKQQS